MSRARYIMVGGFLGAGKTTALLQLASRLQAQGQRVGLITNDQSFGLVDTAMLGAHDFPVEEITGGCFCCRFNSLTDAAAKLSEEERPDVFLAEPVGSCTDLTATVSYPLRRMYGDNYSVAPYSVLIDPIRAERILGLESGKSFSPKVIYIYLKQLEEAEIVVVNKIDLLEPARLDRLVRTLNERFPNARVITMSARLGTNLDEWCDSIATMELGTALAMDVDYDTYADGEALLGWVNLAAMLDSEGELFDGNGFVESLMSEIHRRVNAEGVEVAHLKMTFSPNEGNDLAVANLVRNDGKPEFSHLLQDPLDGGELLLNLRAEADPELLKKIATDSLKELADSRSITADVSHVEAFRPGRPVPTHRDTVA